jgi:membrane protease YdiL (CAAX protease family)
MFIAEIDNSITSPDQLIDNIFIFGGLMSLGYWLITTGLGRKALADSKQRPNTMPIYLPFIPLLFYMIIISSALMAVEKACPDLKEWQHVLIQNLILCTGTILCIGVILYLAKTSFTDKLKGFGLQPKGIHKDLGAAALTLISIWPIIMVVFVMTIYIGQAIFGDEFEISRHRELESIAAYPQFWIRTLIVFTAAFVVPIFEELLFRGLFQTTIRSSLEHFSFFKRVRNESLIPWAAIIITSVLFTLAHEDKWHWPALFVLSCGMGYAYEKSGSLLRPIFVHLLFNSIALASTLLST